MKLKVPPVIIFFLALTLMFGVYYLLPNFTFRIPYSITSSRVFLLLGVLSGVAGIATFRKKGTTVDPMNPQNASKLVTSGIYRYTRNPMYLGMLFVLIGGLIRLGNPTGLIGIAFFIFWINEFQIKPEERVLTEVFEDEYREYCAKVRRWI